MERTGHSHQTACQHHKGQPNPPPRRHRRQDPQRDTGGPPSQNRQHQARSSGPPGEGTPKTRRHTPRWDEEKKEPATQPEREGMGGQGPQGPGQGQPATNTTKPKQDTKKKHTLATQPRRAGHSRDPGPARTPTPHTAARKGGRQAGRAHKHTPPQSTPNQEVQETTRDGRTSTHTPQHPPKEWRGAAKTQTPARTPTPHTGTGNGGVQAERARNHARPISPTTKGGLQAKTQAQPRTPQTPAGKRGTTPQTVPEHTTQDPSQDWRGYRNPHPTATRTQTQAPHNSRKPSVQSPGTEAARAMQLTRPNKIRSPGVRLHPKACAAVGLEAERATPKRLRTLVPRTCMHALGTGYGRKSGEPLAFRQKEGTCTSTGSHPPGETSTSGRQPRPPGVARGRFVGGQQSGLA